MKNFIEKSGNLQEIYNTLKEPLFNFLLEIRNRAVEEGGLLNLLYICGILKNLFSQYMETTEKSEDPSEKSWVQEQIKLIDDEIEKLNKVIGRIESSSLFRGFRNSFFSAFISRRDTSSEAGNAQKKGQGEIIQGLRKTIVNLRIQRARLELIRDFISKDMTRQLDAIIKELELRKVKIEEYLSENSIDETMDAIRISFSHRLPTHHTQISTEYTLEKYLPVETCGEALIQVDDEAVYDLALKLMLEDLLQMSFNSSEGIYLGECVEEINKFVCRQAIQLTNDQLHGTAPLMDVLINLIDQDLDNNGARSHQAQYQIDQFFNRCSPFWNPDLDQRRFSEENIERLRLVLLPAMMKKGLDTDENQDLFSLFKHNHIPPFEPVLGEHDYRLDALSVAHGLPVNLIGDLDRMYEDYENMGSSPLHIRKEFREGLPNIHLSSNGADHKGQAECNSNNNGSGKNNKSHGGNGSGERETNDDEDLEPDVNRLY